MSGFKCELKFPIKQTFFLNHFRFEQSIAEATKIARIREELDKLDQELATDVEILRKEIEAVTLQYTNTRYIYLQLI